MSGTTQQGGRPATATQFDAGKFVLGFLGAVFTAVAFFIGTTVNKLTTEIAKLGTTMEVVVKQSDGYAGTLQALIARVSTIELEQAKRTERVYSLKQLQSTLQHIEKELGRREGRIEAIEADLDSRKNKRWNRPDQEAFENRLEMRLKGIEAALGKR